MDLVISGQDAITATFTYRQIRYMNVAENAFLITNH